MTDSARFYSERKIRLDRTRNIFSVGVDIYINTQTFTYIHLIPLVRLFSYDNLAGGHSVPSKPLEGSTVFRST